MCRTFGAFRRGIFPRGALGFFRRRLRASHRPGERAAATRKHGLGCLAHARSARPRAAWAARLSLSSSREILLNQIPISPEIAPYRLDLLHHPLTSLCLVRLPRPLTCSATELRILTLLSWRLHYITPHHCLNGLLASSVGSTKHNPEDVKKVRKRPHVLGPTANHFPTTLPPHGDALRP